MVTGKRKTEDISINKDTINFDTQNPNKAEIIDEIKETLKTQEFEYEYLDDDKKYGLGGYLYEKLNKEIPIIGVAKTNFASIEKNKKPLFRGDSIKPLFITSLNDIIFFKLFRYWIC